jgi:hypothetical protein
MLDNLKKILLPTKEEIKADIPVLLSEGSKAIKSFLSFVKKIRERRRFAK